MDLKERIEWLERELEKTKELVLETEQEEKNFPKNGDEFYFIDEHGLVIFATFDADYIGNERIKNIGNCFRTREEAEFEVERLKVLKELKEFACDIKEFKLYDDKWYLSYNSLDKKISIDRDGIFARHGIYFKRKEDAEQVLELVGEERIIKYYIGIKENENDK